MARRRRSFFRRRRSPGRRVHRNRRGVGGKGILQSVMRRPLKYVAGALGLATVGILVTDGSAAADGGSVVNDILTAQSTGGASLQNIPYHLVASVTAGNWIGPAIGTAVVGYISRRFKV